MCSKKLVFGVGLNDADYYTQSKKVIHEDGAVTPAWCCPFYSSWKHILERVYCPKFLKRNPTYKGCSIQESWLTFSNFKCWMEKQNWEGKQPDKDILFIGNKLYSEDTCIFVSPAINKFFNQNKGSRGKYPLGVTYEASSRKYVARCQDFFTKKRKTLGRYSTPEEAHEVWYKYKLCLAEEICSSVLVDDPRLPEAIIALVVSMKDK